MASGAQHERASTRLILLLQPFLLLVAIVALSAHGLDYLELWTSLLIAVSATGFLFGLYVGRRVTPDLDIDEVLTRQTRRYLKRNRFLGTLWRIYWLPYALYHPHRGLSHSLLVGTLGRWFYLFPIPILLTGWLAWLVWPDVRLVVYLCAFWIAEYWGQFLQDLLHIWMDR